MEFLRELLASIGGFVGVTLIILVFFKGVIQKWIDTTIDKAAEKNIVKYSNTLERRTKAYEILLNKELSYYEYLSNTISDLIMGMGDYFVHIGVDETKVAYTDVTKACKEFSKLQEVECELSRRHAAMCCYIQNDISIAVMTLIKDLQLVNKYYTEGIEQIAKTNNLREETSQEIQRLTNVVVTSGAKINSLINQRLTALSQE